MQKWGIVTIIFTVTVLTGKIFNQTQAVRTPAAFGNDAFKNCTKSLSNFSLKGNYNKTAYEKYLQLYKSLDSVPDKDKFESTADYIAWLDAKIDSEHVSLGEYLFRENSKFLTLKRILISRSRPDRKLNYLFSTLFEELVAKSVKIEDVNIHTKKGLYFAIQEKLSKEALEKIEGEPDGRFAKFMNNKYTGYALDWFGFLAPIYGGHLPIRIPEFLSKNRADLFSKQTLKDMEKHYDSLGYKEQRTINAEIAWNQFRRKYHLLAAVGYIIYGGYGEYAKYEKNVETSERNDSHEDALEGLRHLGDKCYDLVQCLEDYRDSWEGSEDKYIQAKEDCILFYDIQEESCKK